MNAEIRVALVYSEVYDLAHFREKRKEFPPFGVLYLAAFLEENNIIVNIFKISDGNEVQDFKGYDIVGFSISSSATYNLVKKTRFASLYSKDSIIAVGGVHPSFYPQETLIDLKASVVVIGNGEKALLKIAQSCKSKDFSQIDGACYLKESSLVINPESPLGNNIDWLPFPARHLIDKSDFIMSNRLANTDTLMTHIMLSRGCPFSCRFCAVMQKKLQYRSGENVKMELEYLKRKYKIKGFAIVDDNFVINKSAVRSICKSIKGLKLKWSALSRIDTVNYEILETMRDAGCIELKFGVESGSERILRAMGKNISCNQIRQTITLSYSLGIGVKIFLVHGFPGENMESTEETISLLKDIGNMVDRVSLFRFVPLPGSYVFKNPREFNLNISEKMDWERFHIYNNDYHWWGSLDDFREVESSYCKLQRFISDNWR